MEVVSVVTVVEVEVEVRVVFVAGLHAASAPPGGWHVWLWFVVYY